MFRFLRKYIRGFHWRIALPYTFLLILILGGIGIFVSHLIQKIHLDTLEESLISQTRLIGDAAVNPIMNLESYENLDELSKHWAGMINARVTIIGPFGLVLGESQEDRSEMDNHINRPEIRDAADEGFGTSIRFSQTVGMEMLYASVPIYQNEVLIGYSRVALPLEQVEIDINQFQNNIFIFTIIIAFVVIYLGFWIANRTTRPIRELNASVTELAQGNLDKRFFSPSNDEIGKLTESIDRMAQKLNQQFGSLRSEESKLSAILDQMTDGVVIVDQSGNVVLLNRKAAQLFEIEENPLPGSTSLIQLLHHHQFVDLWKNCLETGREQSMIVEVFHPKRFMQGIASPLGDYLEGYILLLFQDLTNVRHLETVRRDFISNISHELRTPLASLKALAETLQSGALNDPPAAIRFLNQIEVEVDALNQMTSELLELARIESSEIEFEFSPTDTCSLLNSSCERLCLQAERAGINISIKCGPDLPGIKADKSRLQQVFVNLIHNAIKFTHNGGEIIVAANYKNGLVRFSVEDNGPGISESNLKRIFERFYKTDRARTGRGTGLGLAIARHIVEAHGGKIWVESREGIGSIFFFDIPSI
ncbi:MAG: HAMP domain-containing protein [Anaerolineaceae bacterium]|nr:HAMP domain-containing protein [Anaerolineaceae bacterium]